MVFVHFFSITIDIPASEEEEIVIVQSSSIGMESARTYTSVSREAFRTEKSGGILTFFDSLSDAGVQDKKSAPISEEGKEKESSGKADVKPQEEYEDIFNKMRAKSASLQFNDKIERDAMQKIRVQCIMYLINLLFGRTVSADEDTAENNLTTVSTGDVVSGGDGTWIIGKKTTSFYHYYSESEETTFSTQGKVVCADGRELDFNLELTMSRSFTEYYEENHVSFETQFMDPLVINLDSSISEVSDVKVKFDLDSDGTKEDMRMLSGNRGYLAFDRNGDGIINDGSELFGTKSGDGFADLAVFDEDENGWIDEADDIFDKLTICFFNEDGTQEICKLKDKGIGAICLRSESTDFSLNDLSSNETNARIRRTGIFLYENGEIGTIQNLDLAQ